MSALYSFRYTWKTKKSVNSKDAIKKYKESDDKVVNFKTLILHVTLTEFCDRD